MPTKQYSIPLKTIVEENHLEPVHLSKDYESVQLVTADVNRPALQLAGFYDYFDPTRLQVIGTVESTYLATLSHEERLHTFDEFMRYDIPGLVVCHGMLIYPECLEIAVKYDRNLFICEDDTSNFQANVILALHKYLAPRIATHGVLVEVYGEGVLILGDSGIGKSETALELIKRGHRLIADDSVEIRRLDKNTLLGNAPENIRYYMELRGIGIINARYLYGIGAVKAETYIDMIIKLEPWVEGHAYDRLGLDEETETILGVSKPFMVVPVRPGRNIAMILEVAAMNNRQKKMGYNAADELTKALDAAIDGGMV